MVKGNSPEAMIAYLDQLIDGTRGVDGKELRREVPNAFEELVDFTEVNEVRLTLPYVERFTHPFYTKAAVEHVAYLGSRDNPRHLKHGVLSKVVSPFSDRWHTHPLVGMDYGKVASLDPDGFVFRVKPKDSDVIYSVLAARENLRKPSAYIIAVVYS